jgi:hypothetical protein
VQSLVGDVLAEAVKGQQQDMDPAGVRCAWEPSLEIVLDATAREEHIVKVHELGPDAGRREIDLRCLPELISEQLQHLVLAVSPRLNIKRAHLGPEGRRIAAC